ncbi:MAG TPA: ribosome biogenesis GTPase Der [Candidatus Sumerlaeota bacterium]|nr:ribosome biogenesis GTPase Der [Candidatus Sumerlaeota bacterium]HPS01152.1 ribosome biogenesis GTPase Der [Candidatus Sumerlaeota bacterium]
MPTLEILDSTLPMVAIVGRPNVGKSTLFNRIIGRRKAVVLDTPGITRDRNFEHAEWNGRAFTLVDTGGYESEPRDITFQQMRQQSLMAVQEADVVVFLTDVQDSENPVDLDVVDILRRSNKPVILAVNKCDSPRVANESYGFSAFGFEHQYPISALSGTGVGDLLDGIVELLPEQTEDFNPSAHGVRIAVIGRPNVGKSLLVNSMLQRERVIVSEMAGTTRDTIDTSFKYIPDGGSEEDARIYTIIDTAGLRRRGKIERGVEKISSFSAEASLRRCDVALVLIDANEGLTEQDQRVAGYAFEAFKPCIIVVNKWDLVEKDNNTSGAFVKRLYEEMGFLNFAPIIMTSAKTGQRIHKILGLVDKLYAESLREISTPELNRWLKDTTTKLSPPWRKGRQLRIKYATQIGMRPPTFSLFVNSPELVHFSYERYLINQLREAFGFEGVPIRLKFNRKSGKRASDMIDYEEDD